MENSEEWHGKMADSENTQGKVWKYDPFVQCAEVMSL